MKNIALIMAILWACEGRSADIGDLFKGIKRGIDEAGRAGGKKKAPNSIPGESQTKPVPRQPGPNFPGNPDDPNVPHIPPTYPFPAGYPDPTSNLEPIERVAYSVAKGELTKARSDADRLLATETGERRLKLLRLRAATFSVPEEIDAADSAWSVLGEEAKKERSVVFEVEALVARSFVWQRNSATKANQFWEQARELSQSAAKSQELAELWNLAGVAQYSGLRVTEAQDAWESSTMIFAGLGTKSLECKAMQLNKGIFTMMKALVDKDPDATLSLADKTLQEALADTPADQDGLLLRARALRTLCELAEARDEFQARDRFGEEFRQLLREIPDDQLHLMRSIGSPEFAIRKTRDGAPHLIECSKGSSFMRPKTHSNDSREATVVKNVYESRERAAIYHFLEAMSAAGDWDAKANANMAMPGRGGWMGGMNEEMLRQVNNQPKVGEMLRIQREARLGEILTDLPGSGQGVCVTNEFEAMARFAPRRDLIPLPPGFENLYDRDAVPSAKLGMLQIYSRPEILAKTAMMEFDVPNLIGSKTRRELHACGYDRPTWQLGELYMADSWNFYQTMAKVAGLPGNPLGEVDTVFRDLPAFLEAIDKAERSRKVEDRNTALDRAEQIAEIDKKWRDKFPDWFQRVEQPRQVLPLLDTAYRSLDNESVYCVIEGVSGMASQWMTTVLWRESGETTCHLSVRTAWLPALLLWNFQRAVFEREASDLARTTEWGRRVFARLFPDADTAARIRAAKRVVIIPTSSAWTVPYAALVVNTEGEPQYLGTEKRLSIVQSEALLRDLEGRTVQGKKSLVVSGLSYDGPKQVSVTERYKAGRLPALPDSAEAGKKIAGIWGASAVSDEAAKEPVITEQMKDAVLIHIATHGYAPLEADGVLGVRDMVKSLRSGGQGIWLSPNAEATSPAEDGLLQAWEIRFKHHLKADLVTVAACETGKSKALFNKGPDLPMSLLYAGARSVIAPLSRVDDTSTAFLMLEVHKNIHAGLEKDEALRAAMVATRKKPGFEHPYYWGAFELFGATQNGLVARN